MVETCTSENYSRNVTLNRIIINFYLLLAIPYGLKDLKESMHNKFFPELIFSSGMSLKFNA
jgi:hypothetical protein